MHCEHCLESIREAARKLDGVEEVTGMTGSPVLVIPALAQAPEEMLANVYVFTNGVKGGGPLGFQPDDFDNPPGAPGYRPLRMVYLFTWQDEPSSRELKSVAEVKEAEAKGEVTIERTGVVVNMPFVTWLGATIRRRKFSVSSAD